MVWNLKRSRWDTRTFDSAALWALVLGGLLVLVMVYVPW